MKESPGHVVLVHGLGRTSASMVPLGLVLRRAGFSVSHVGYPHRGGSIETMARRYVAPALERALERHARVDVVTHSLGGLLLRACAVGGWSARLHRAVLIAPPNAGSEVADWFHAHPVRAALFGAVMGPAALELVTAAGGSCARLAPLDCEVGVIAGTSGRGQLFSPLLSPPHDGKVTVASASVPWMKELSLVPVNHTLVLLSPTTWRRAVAFLRLGTFRDES